ncbi:hypothetical protein PBI_WALRUS_82 [Gordonia phage Walrus]|uniref:Uncharacterized protein n=1 Tax=Gordonia phage Walrus TaxID=2517927 RepID=A0A481S2C8_9CAUD|nr:hypothetical protein KNU50_gp82 [Gordonia phage Walrus]QBG78472.1 hypothetical protein PBI_WALRUS_82 [Gordonia phage Walrus]
MSITDPKPLNRAYALGLAGGVFLAAFFGSTPTWLYIAAWAVIAWDIANNGVAIYDRVRDRRQQRRAS